MFWMEAKLQELLCRQSLKNAQKEYNERYKGMWFKTSNGVEYKVNDKFIGNKMTREEAVKILQNKAVMSRTFADQFTDALEALGLLKFEEEKKTISECLNSCYGSQIGVDIVLKNLDRNGYKIMEK